jgi:hypothetical protein
MNLWQVDDTQLTEIQISRLDTEQRLEDWIASDPSIAGLDLVIIGRQVVTDYGGRVDLLGIDSEGNLAILELKRDRTPRDIVAQILDYASWVKDLTYQEINRISEGYLKTSLSAAFQERFEEALPEKINISHSMVIIAAELDDASERIVQYLANEHNISINAIFFNVYQLDSQEILGRAWLMDPVTVQERAVSRKQAPWTGYYFVNVGESTHRNWDDNRRYGVVSAGQGAKYSRHLKKLQSGDKIFAYLKGAGYVGYGEVTQPAQMIKDFIVPEIDKPLLDLDLKAKMAADNKDNPELSEWVVGVKWAQTVPRDEAKTFKGVFANQNVVCKLRHPETVEFVKREFDVSD